MLERDDVQALFLDREAKVFVLYFERQTYGEIHHVFPRVRLLIVISQTKPEYVYNQDIGQSHFLQGFRNILGEALVPSSFFDIVGES